MITTIIEHQPFRWTAEQFDQMSGLGWFQGQRVEFIAGEVLLREISDTLVSRRWTRDEYFRMLDLGWFDNHRVELIGGEVLEMPAQKNRHAMGIALTTKALELAFGASHWVRVQMSLDLSPLSVPDPDLAVVPGDVRSSDPDSLPTTALLLVEISETTLGFDRAARSSLYATSNIADYWIVNLVQRQLEVHRDPVADPAAAFGASYATRRILDPGETAAPLAVPQTRIRVADLLP